jgi:peptidoglycan hydrolase-like protein with peptidoglycan-binding domain
MPGFPRDLAALEPWEASIERSRARRERSSGKRPGGAPTLAALLDARRRLGGTPRDLADIEPWELSLGRSRARRRAAQLRFVPAGTRAKRVSLGALVALTAGPTATLAEASGTGSASGSGNAEPPTTSTEHSITLSSGSEGRQVRLLQQALGIGVDGIYGPETERAVESLQSAHGLSVDGVAGPATFAALRGGSARALTASLSSPFSQDVQGGDPVNESGSQAGGSAVKALQEALHIQADGSFGPETERAVRSYQDAHGLHVDGVVGPATWNALGVHGQETLTPPSSAVQEASHTPSAHAAAAPATGQGGTARYITRLQEALHIPADGNFGPETEAAIRRLQETHGLHVDGVVGPETWNAAHIQGAPGTIKPPHSAMLHAAAFEHHSSSAGNPQSPSNAGASKTSAVERLQSALHIPVDGNFGPETERAVRSYQDTHGLTVDGVVGPATWDALGIPGAHTLNPPQSSSSSATGSSGQSSVVARVIAAADEIATRPYVFGGGHGSFSSEGYDCSGSVSYALHGGGLLSSPEDSSALESYGEAGPGKYITIYANAEHAWMTIDGRRFDTIAQQETGTRWSDSMTSTAGYVVRHPSCL